MIDRHGTWASRVGLVGLALLLGVAVALVLLGLRSEPDDTTSASLAGSVAMEPPPEPLEDDATYVRTTVLPSGELEVTHWIEASSVLLTLDLSVPAGPDGVVARDVRVVADGHEAIGPERITDGRGTYSFLAADSVLVTYRLGGALVRSTSAPGRALVSMSSLEVSSRAAAERATHEVSAPEVLSLACATPDEPAEPQPCGAPDADGGWSVDLEDGSVRDRVLAQVTVG
ncbi:hypothetical protein [Nocardioides sediminis]|uniref:hypothetical protein n=1 Tax=Nocardioides sediminis TaxID=433648 RepID=UPI000D3118AC|nr:hypothetical protein [Nocardioides sediminis]